MTAQPAPIACNPNAFTRDERDHHLTATTRLKAAVVMIEESADGYRWHIDDRLPTSEILQWVEHERRCCPFLDFEVRLARDNGRRSIPLTGRDGVKAFLAVEFADLIAPRGRHPETPTPRPTQTPNP